MSKHKCYLFQNDVPCCLWVQTCASCFLQSWILCQAFLFPTILNAPSLPHGNSTHANYCQDYNSKLDKTIKAGVHAYISGFCAALKSITLSCTDCTNATVSMYSSECNSPKKGLYKPAIFRADDLSNTATWYLEAILLEALHSGTAGCTSIGGAWSVIDWEDRIIINVHTQKQIDQA